MWSLSFAAKKPQAKKGPKKSSFEKELTDTSRKAVKGLRYK